MLKNKNVKTIILCGKEVWGHKTGHSLLALHKNGIDQNNRIIKSKVQILFYNFSKMMK